MSGSDDPVDVPSLPGDIAALLADARSITAPPEELRARLRARLASGVPPPPSSPPSATGEGGSPTLAQSSGAAAARWAQAPWWAVAAAFVVGAGVGRLLPSATSPRDETSSQRPVSFEAMERARVSSVAIAPVVGPSASSPSAAGALPIQTPLSTSAPSAAASSLAAHASAGPGDLAVERRLLEVARTALGRGNGADALVAVDEHARRFRHGALAEEREAIAVQALIDSDRQADARARGARFERDYPKSILLPTVRAALERH